jgi:hypothetical protein
MKGEETKNSLAPHKDIAGKEFLSGDDSRVLPDPHFAYLLCVCTINTEHLRKLRDPPIPIYDPLLHCDQNWLVDGDRSKSVKKEVKWTKVFGWQHLM